MPATRNINAVPLGAAFQARNQDRSQYALNTIPMAQANLPAAYTAANPSYTGGPLGQFFGEPTSARFPRVIQIQARFSF